MTDSDALVSFVTAPSLFIPKGGPKLLLLSPNKQWFKLISDIIIDTPMRHPVTIYYAETDDEEAWTWNLYHTSIATNVLVYLNTTETKYVATAAALSRDKNTFITLVDEGESLSDIFTHISSNPISSDSFAQLQSIINQWSNDF